MENSDIVALSRLIDTKIKLLKSYEDITIRLITDDIEKLDMLIDVRQGLLENYNKATAEINSIVARQSSGVQEKLNAMLRYKEIDEASAPFIDLNEKLLALKAVINSINQNEKTVSARLNGYRQDLINEMLKLNKSKKVIDYFDTTTNSDIFHGKEFDEKL